MELEEETSGEGRGSGKRGRAVAVARDVRDRGDAQEVWCAGSDGAWGCIVIAFVGVVALMAMFSLMIVDSLAKKDWRAFVTGDIQKLGVSPEVYWLTVALLMVVAGVVVLCAWGALLASVNRTVVRLEPGRVKVIVRPLSWGSIFEVEAGEIKGVRIGKSGRGGGAGVERTVVVELGEGRYAWLVQSRGVGEAESVAWEVADYYGVPCRTAATEGDVVGRAWMPMKGDEPDLSGVEAWSEARVLEAGLAGWEMEVDAEGRVTLMQPMMRNKAMYCGRLVVMAAVAGVIGWMFWMGGVWGVAGVGLVMCGGLIGALYVVMASVTDLVEARVRISGAGVFGRMRIPGWTFASQRYEGERVVIARPGRGGDSNWKNMEMGRLINRRRKLDSKIPFWVVMVMQGVPGWRSVIVSVDGEPGYALGLAALFERAMKGAAFEEVEAEKKAEEVVDGQGRVMMSSNKMPGLCLMVVGVGMALFAGLLALDVLPGSAPGVKPADAGRAVTMDYGSRVVLAGCGLVLTFFGAAIYPQRWWMEISDGKLKVQSCGWSGEATREMFEAGEVERAWVRYRHGGSGRPAVNGGALMLRLRGGEGRSVEVKKAWDILPKEGLARGVNQLLGMKDEEVEIGMGLETNGVFLKVNEENEVVLPEGLLAGGCIADSEERVLSGESGGSEEDHPHPNPLPEGEGAGKRQRVTPSYALRQEGERVEMARKGVRVNGSDVLICVMMSLLAGMFGTLSLWGKAVNDRQIGMVVTGLLLGGIAVNIVACLMRREWVSVAQGKIEMREMSLTGMRVRSIWMEDVLGLKVLCEEAMIGKRVEFAVVMECKEQEQVRVATRIRHAEEAIGVRDTIREAMVREREAVATRESREWERREKVGRFLGKR
jgi:hypothetical protein